MAHLRRTTVAIALALGVALGTAACGGDDASSGAVTLADWGAQGGPRDWATPGATPSGQSPERKAVVMPRLGLTVGDKGNVDSGQWPDAKDLFTEQALKALFPDGKDFETTDCAPGSYEDGSGNKTAKNSRCTYQVALPSDSGGKSRLKVAIRAAGADNAVTRSYENENGAMLTSDSARESSIDRVWKNGAWGAKRLVKTGGDYRLLISDGKVGVYLVLNFDGFNVFGQSMAERQKGLEARLLPFVVQDLAWRLPAG